MSDLGSGWFGRMFSASATDSKSSVKSFASTPKRRRRTGMMALEPRIMYDAAAAATVGAAQTQADGAADHAVITAAEQKVHANATNTGTVEPQAAATQPLTQSSNVQTPSAPPALPEDVKTTALDTSSTAVPSGSAVHDVVIIDSRVPDIEKLIEGVKPGDAVFVLDPNRDGMQQIVDILQTNNLHDLSAIQIVSHGLEGEVQLGSTTLKDSNLESYAAQLGTIGASLSADGDILLYGCYVGHGDAGMKFLSDLSAKTGADVAASTQAVGDTSTGINWTLDATTGAIEADLPFAAETIATYDSSLANSLTGQLWYTTQGNPADARLVRINNDNSSNTVLFDNDPTTTLGTAFPQDVQLDTAAGLYYFIANSGNLASNARLMMGHIGSSAAPTTLVTFAADSAVNTLQIDPFTHHIYVGELDQVGTATLEGIRDYTYDPATGAITPVATNGGWLVRADQQTGISPQNVPGYGTVTLFDPRDFALDKATNTLFWVNEADGAAYANQIYKLNLSNPTVVTPLLLQSQFSFSDSGVFANGYITSVDVDPSTGLVYFTTHSQYPSPDAAYSAATNKIYWINESATGSTAATALTITGLPAGNTFYPGKMTFDLQTRQIYVASEEKGNGTGADAASGDDVIYVLQLDSSGHTASFVRSIYPSPAFGSNAANLGGFAFDALPVLTVGATSTHAIEQGAYVDLTASNTSTDVDGGYYASAVVQITGGKFTSNESSTSDDHLSVLDGGTNRTSGIFTGTNITVSYDAATEKLTLTGYDTIANYNMVLGHVRYNATGDNPTNYGANTTRTISWSVNDGVADIPFGAQNSATTILTIDAVNDAPTATAPVGHYNVVEKVDLNLRNTGFSVADIDGGITGQTETVTLSVGEGKITIVAGNSGVTGLTGNGTSSVTFSGTIAQINALLNTSTGTITYNDPSDNPVSSTALTLSIADGGNTGASVQTTVATATIDITNLNSPASIIGFSNPAAKTEAADASAQDIPASTGTLTVSDSDTGDTLTASVAGNAVAKLNGAAANLPAGIDLSALISTSAIGFNTAVSNGGAKVLTWTYDPAAVNLDFLKGGDVLTIEYTASVSDGHGTYGSQILTITINGTNDAPTTSNASVGATEDTPYVFKAADFPFADTRDRATETLGTVIITSLPAGGALSYNGIALTPADVASGLSISIVNIGLLKFLPAANANGANYASFGFAVRDTGGTAGGGADTSTSATMTINVAAVNDAPVAQDDIYAGNQDTTLHGTSVLVNDSDVDTAAASLQAVLVSGPGHATTFTLNADGTFTYVPVAGFFGPDTFTYKVNDGSANSNTVTVTINIASSPIHAVSDSYTGAAGATEDTTLVVSAANGVLANDFDTEAGHTLTATVVTGPAHGTLVLAADGSFTYNPAADFYGNDGFTYQVSDGTNPPVVGTVSIAVAGVNDAPVLLPLAPVAVGYLENAAATALFAGETITDADGPANFGGASLSVAITSGSTPGDQMALIGASGFSVTAGTLYDGATAIGTVTDTPTSFSVSLNNAATVTVVNRLATAFNFQNTTDNPQATDRMVRLTFNDGGNVGTGTPVDVSVNQTIHVTPVNDAPVVTAGNAVGYGEQAAPVLLASAITVSDADSASLTRATVTITDFVAGDTLAVQAAAGLHVISNSNGVLVFELTGPAGPADYQAALRQVTFSNAGDDPTVGGSHNTRSISWVVTDTSGADSAVTTTALTVVADNDAPSILAPTAIHALPGAAVTITGVVFADSDGGTLSEQVTFSASNGAFAAIAGGGVTVSGLPTSVVLTGNVADLNAFIAAGTLGFTPAPGELSVSVTVTFNDLGHTGAAAASSTTSFVIAVNSPPVAPVDNNAAANSVLEGAAVGTTVGITAHATDVDAGDVVTYSIVGAGSNAFQIDANSGVVSVKDASLIDYESSALHTATITVQAADGNGGTVTTDFVINIEDVAPTVPADVNGLPGGNVSEGATNGDAVGITATASDINGGAVTYSLGNDAGGRFAINSTTGVVSVANAALLNYETATSHQITVIASDGTLANSQTFTISVIDMAPTVPVDGNAPTGGTISEGAVNGDTVGVTATSADVNGGTVVYSLTDNAGGRFAIDGSTGVVTVANALLLDFETATSHDITTRASDASGAFTEQTFNIGVTDIAPAAPLDGDAAANSVSEAAANGDMVGITAVSADVHGGAVTFSLHDDAGGRFAIDSNTGVVSVANASLLDFESSALHTIVVRASDASGLFSDTNYTIAVTDVAPTVPLDANGAGDMVVEGAANGTLVGLTALSSDIHGGNVTYSLSSDASNGGFTINSVTGMVSVADASKVDFESSGGSYAITVRASDAAGLFTEKSYAIAVVDAAPSLPSDIDGGAGGSVSEAAVNGSAVGIVISSTDINGGIVTLSLSDDASGRFAIDASGVVTVANASLLNYEGSTSHAITVRAADAGGAFTQQTFTIDITDVAPTTPIDGNAASDRVSEGAVNGDLVGITAVSTDVHGGQVIFSLNDDAGGRFTIDSITGVVSVANASLLDFESNTSHSIVVRAEDPNGLSTETIFTIAVINVAPTQPVDTNGATNVVAEGAANGSFVGITASSADVHGGAVIYTLSADSSLGGFAIDAATGKVTVADGSKIDFESSGGSHVITVRASDLSGAFTDKNFTVAVTDVAPVAAGEAISTDEDTAIVVDARSGLLINDSDVNGASLTAVRDTGPAHGTLTLNADGSFSYVAFHDFNGTDSFTYHVSDGTLSSAIVAVNLTVNPVNDAPVLVSGNTLAFDANSGAPVVLSPGITLHDVDSTTMAGARVVISGGFESTDDLLGFVNQNGITGSFDRNSGVLTLTGVASVTDYQAALASVTFSSTTQRSGPRTIAWTVDDGGAAFSQSAVTRTTLGVSGIIVPPPVFSDNRVVIPPQTISPAPLGFDTMRTSFQASSDRPDGFSSNNSYGYQVVYAKPVLAMDADATMKVDLALDGLRDALGGNVVYVIARQANGDPLPEWLTFNPVTGKFAGLPPDGMVASIQGDQLGDSDIVTGALPSMPDVGLMPPARAALAKTLTVEVLARDSRGNIAVTTFTIELKSRAGKQGSYIDRSVLPGESLRHAGMASTSPELAAIEAAVRDVTRIVEPFALRGLPVPHREAIMVGGVVAPVGRAGLSEQMASIGWRAMTAQRDALLASLKQEQ